MNTPFLSDLASDIEGLNAALAILFQNVNGQISSDDRALLNNIVARGGGLSSKVAAERFGGTPQDPVQPDAPAPAPVDDAAPATPDAPAVD